MSMAGRGAWPGSNGVYSGGGVVFALRTDRRRMLSVT